MTVARLEKLFIQCLSSKAAWREKPNKENAFQQPIDW
ncbi:hypothetical protein T11_9783, partial [Trichinella zimbabwensis]